MTSAEPPENVGKTEVPELEFDMIQSEIRGFDKSGKQLKFFQRKKGKGILSCWLSFQLCRYLMSARQVQIRCKTLKFLEVKKKEEKVGQP